MMLPLVLLSLTRELMQTFVDLLRESVIVQGVITIVFVVTICVLWIEGKPISPDLIQFVSLIIGFYFGAKVQSLIHKAKG